MFPLQATDRQLLDAIPSCVFVMDQNMVIHDLNTAAAALTNTERGSALFEREGAAINCINNGAKPGGCGQSVQCQSCLVRQAVVAAYETSAAVRREARMDLRTHTDDKPMHCLVTASPITLGGQKLVLLVVEDITEVTVLRRLLPICMYCKKIRDERENWWDVDTYLRKRMDILLSHGICPSCFEIKKAELLASLPPSAAASAPR